MGRPKGSKNKPKTDKPAVVKPPKPDKKVNFTLLNGFLAAATEALSEMSKGMRAERESIEAHTKFMNMLGGNVQTGPVPETAAVVENETQATQATEAAAKTEEPSATVEQPRTESDAKPTDLGTLLGTEDPVSK